MQLQDVGPLDPGELLQASVASTDQRPSRRGAQLGQVGCLGPDRGLLAWTQAVAEADESSRTTDRPRRCQGPGDSPAGPRCAPGGLGGAERFKAAGLGGRPGTRGAGGATKPAP